MERIDLSGKGFGLHQFDNGFVISARKEEKQSITPGDTALHESKHIIAARRIRRATIIPSGDALGTTEPEVMTARAAAAAAAEGHDGTGWDLFITEHLLGVHPEVAMAEARAELAGQEEEMHEVAVLLETRKTIGQRDVDEARENVRKRRGGIFSVDVTITSPDGKNYSYQDESTGGSVMIPDKWVTLTHAK